MSNPKKNFIYNFAYQILAIIVPVIVSPYLSRILGADGVGVYSYTYSIMHYLMLLTMLGVNNYGNRTIAKVRDDKDKLSKSFWSIYSMQLITGLAMLILYIAFIVLFGSKYKLIFAMQIPFVISAILDINWFFFGLEEFKKTITRNSVLKVGSVILIFLLVKNSGDVWKYTLIMSGMTCLSQLVLWTFIRNKIVFVKVKWKDIKAHIKPNLVLFIPVIAISLYKVMDKIMLGLLADTIEVGLYENAEKIINIPLVIITALGTVMLPRMSNIIAKGDKATAEKYISKSTSFVLFLSLAMCCGLIGIGYHFAPFFFGAEFQKTGVLIMLLAVTLPFISFANVIRTQYLIPREKDKIYIKSVFLGAAINLVMNLIFISEYGSIGACIGTIAAEITVMVYQLCSVKNELPIRIYLLKNFPFVIKSLIMLIIVFIFNYIDMKSLVRLLVQVGLGCLIYGLLNLKYIMSIVNFKHLFKKIRLVKSHK